MMELLRLEAGREVLMLSRKMLKMPSKVLLPGSRRLFPPFGEREVLGGQVLPLTPPRKRSIKSRIRGRFQVPTL